MAVTDQCSCCCYFHVCGSWCIWKRLWESRETFLICHIVKWFAVELLQASLSSKCVMFMSIH